MQRRKLVATAGALSVTAFAATLAIGANFGLVAQAQPDSPVGRLDDHHQVSATAAATADPATAVVVTTPELGPHADD
jgi:hypothetical protein